MIKLGSNSIGNIFLGNNSLGKAYLGSNLVFQKGSQPVQLIPYIRGGVDGSYIDTGITPDETTKIIVWARNWNPVGYSTNWFFGSRVAYQDSAFASYLMYTANTGKIRVSVATTNKDLSDKWTLMSHYHKYELSTNGFYVDDTLISSTASDTFSNNYNIYLFGVNNAGELIVAKSKIDICACKIYKGENLVRDYIAVNSPSVGLLDLVSGTLFTNAGNGSFTYGSFDPNAYTPLEYIACTKAQYFDAGIHATGNMNIVAKFRANSGDATFKRLFGVRDANNVNMLEMMVGNESSANRYFDCRYNNGYNRIDAGSSQGSVDLVYVAQGELFYLYKNNALIDSTSGTASTFTSNLTMFVGASDTGGIAVLEYSFNGRIYYLGFGSERNFVPAKRNNDVGMYDTYNDVFYPSVTSTPFIAGNEL